jgi:PIN domain nuclease of toxin-antitoxin system
VKVLLDTHTFLWFINDSSELSDTAADLLESDVDLMSIYCLVLPASGKLRSKLISKN